ncbi:hypothetical protein EVAR_63379_1 [Eumeta japonica]|uniref:Uncharacterized protein n=1 Tax=Eumeta variegata TaxID=151549 RepID=A0A4C1YQK3_EUMVA|nr:hypothetical protein EVAR_63379_1 [Eumeta japonica]
MDTQPPSGRLRPNYCDVDLPKDLTPSMLVKNRLKALMNVVNNAKTTYGTKGILDGICRHTKYPLTLITAVVPLYSKCDRTLLWPTWLKNAKGVGSIDVIIDPIILASHAVLFVEIWGCRRDNFEIDGFDEVCRVNGPTIANANPECILMLLIDIADTRNSIQATNKPDLLDKMEVLMLLLNLLEKALNDYLETKTLT